MKKIDDDSKLIDEMIRFLELLGNFYRAGRKLGTTTQQQLEFNWEKDINRCQKKKN